MVAPGIAALFYTPVVVAQAGLAAPLAYPIAFVIVLLTAIVLAQLARAVPGAGGYYNYVSRGINPSAGFLVAWLNIIYAPLVLGAVTVFGGYVISSSLEWTGAAGRLVPARVRHRGRHDRGDHPVPGRPAVRQDAGHHRAGSS